MSSNLPINQSNITAPTPQNTPLTSAPVAPGLSRPTVPDISEAIEEDDDSEGDEAGGPDFQQAMLGMVQGRLASLLGKSSGYIESLPVEVKRTLEGLKGVQAEYEKLQKEFKLEMWELERKYLAKYQPVFDRRRDIVAGKATVTEEEVAAGEEISREDDEDYVPLVVPATPTTDIKGVPEFWLTALRNHLGISELITDRDAGALKHLTDVTVTYIQEEKKTGFVLHFHFAPNEYFTNQVLTKTYLYQDEVGYSGDFLYDRAVGDTIHWKEDKDLTKEIEIKKQRNKNTNRTRVIRKTRPTESFFNFFSPPQPPPAVDEDDEDEEDEDELDDIEERLELDYQIGEDIKERIIPRAVDFFTGKALEFEGAEIDDEDEEDFEDIDSDDVDDDDEVSLDSPTSSPPSLSFSPICSYCHCGAYS
ncbi:NAP-domain-containing protein [Sistotremastrum niveocremeum HHB9708]|uniref:NAP-domain-containing protein n=2 Tax=Sistotremastraceae TaxID=3402574 RepID=A0A164MMG1_9AGAM|nr:NAP-domain-containing protein [Sistotremastrum niveocremeum HHB9708]KZT40347.1 NAP-domain-containing protein [Sistotremastrum suecicum HHB10207 ss-3]